MTSDAKNEIEYTEAAALTPTEWDSAGFADCMTESPQKERIKLAKNTLQDYISEQGGKPMTKEEKQAFEDAVDSLSSKVIYNLRLGQIQETRLKPWLIENKVYHLSAARPPVYMTYGKTMLQDDTLTDESDPDTNWAWEWMAEPDGSFRNERLLDVCQPTAQEELAGIRAEKLFDLMKELTKALGRRKMVMKYTRKNIYDPHVLNRFQGDQFPELILPGTCRWIEPTPVIDLILENISGCDPKGKQHIIDCLLWKYCFPGEKFLPSPVASGVGGSGKTAISLALRHVYGKGQVRGKRLDKKSIENTSYLEGTHILIYDECPPIQGEAWEFIKDVTGGETFDVQEKYLVGWEVETHCWVWIFGNPPKGDDGAGDIKCPVPLAGDGPTGIDRRWSPFIVKRTLVAAVAEMEGIREQDAYARVMEEVGRLKSDPRHILSYLGKHFESSRAFQALQIANESAGEPDWHKIASLRPMAYHGPCYEKLTGVQPGYLSDVLAWLFIAKGDEETCYSMKGIYEVYKDHVKAQGVAHRFVKQRKTVLEDARAWVAAQAPEWQWQERWPKKPNGWLTQVFVKMGETGKQSCGVVGCYSVDDWGNTKLKDDIPPEAISRQIAARREPVEVVSEGLLRIRREVMGKED